MVVDLESQLIEEQVQFVPELFRTEPITRPNSPWNEISASDAELYLRLTGRGVPLVDFPDFRSQMFEPPFTRATAGTIWHFSDTDIEEKEHEEKFFHTAVPEVEICTCFYCRNPTRYDLPPRPTRLNPRRRINRRNRLQHSRQSYRQ